MARAFRIAIRLAFVVVIAVAASQLIDYAMDASDTLSDPASEAMMTSLLIGLLIAYALLIAVPFVPGIEIGITLLVLRGAEMAPAVYAATVLGLLLAYGIGRVVPPKALSDLLSDLYLKRTAALVASFTELSADERLTRLNASLPRALGLLLVRARYLTLAGVLNLPGNALVGGGGGLLMLAGVSRTFRPAPTVLMVLLAVLPVPLLVWIWGPGVL